jgi:DNA-binding GntR family transcriptional regulator
MSQAATGSLRASVSQKLLDLFTSGQVPAGRVNESELARKIKVSRTPLREALVALESAGFVLSQERGFTIPVPRSIEIRELYPIIATLETLALETAGIPDRAQIQELEKINREFRRAARKPRAALAADSRFHNVLLNRCPNARLMNLISRHKLLIRRYEFLYFHHAQFFERSAEQHDEILKSLSARDMARSVAALKSNWMCALDLLMWSVRD